MKTKKGQTRIVIILGGLVIKFPRIDIYYFFKTLHYWFKKGEILKNIRTTTYDKVEVKYYLLKGITNNWSEFLFYQKTKHPFLMPTFFSLFGLLNIQKAGPILQMDGRPFFNAIDKIINKGSWKGGHTFSNPENFCWTNNHLKIVDYGDTQVQSVIKKHGHKIYEDFDLENKGGG